MASMKRPRRLSRALAVVFLTAATAVRHTALAWVPHSEVVSPPSGPRRPSRHHLHSAGSPWPTFSSSSSAIIITWRRIACPSCYWASPSCTSRRSLSSSTWILRAKDSRSLRDDNKESPPRQPDDQNEKSSSGGWFGWNSRKSSPNPDPPPDGAKAPAREDQGGGWLRSLFKREASPTDPEPPQRPSPSTLKKIPAASKAESRLPNKTTDSKAKGTTPIEPKAVKMPSTDKKGTVPVAGTPPAKVPKKEPEKDPAKVEKRVAASLPPDKSPTKKQPSVSSSSSSSMPPLTSSSSPTKKEKDKAADSSSSGSTNNSSNPLSVVQNFFLNMFAGNGEEWVAVFPITRISPGEMVPVTVGGIDLLVIASTDGRRLYCIENSCPHLGTPLETGTLVRLPVEDRAPPPEGSSPLTSSPSSPPSSSSTSSSPQLSLGPPPLKEMFFSENEVTSMLQQDGCEDCIVCPLHRTAFALASGEVRGPWCPYPPVLGALVGTVKRSSTAAVFDIRTRGKNVEVLINTVLKPIPKTTK